MVSADWHLHNMKRKALFYVVLLCRGFTAICCCYCCCSCSRSNRCCSRPRKPRTSTTLAEQLCLKFSVWQSREVNSEVTLYNVAVGVVVKVVKTMMLRWRRGKGSQEVDDATLISRSLKRRAKEKEGGSTDDVRWFKRRRRRWRSNLHRSDRRRRRLRRLRRL